MHMSSLLLHDSGVSHFSFQLLATLLPAQWAAAPYGFSTGEKITGKIFSSLHLPLNRVGKMKEAKEKDSNRISKVQMLRGSCFHKLSVLCNIFFFVLP